MKCSNRIFIAGIIVICLCKLTLIAALRITAIPGHLEDEGLFVNLAVNILNGAWLGPYTDMTLVKGPFFPLFLAANFLLGLPLIFTEHLLYLISGIVLLYALSGSLKNRYLLLLIFIIYAFNPSAASAASNLRIIREGIYPSLTVLVFAAMIGITSSTDRPIKHIVMWALLAGISLSAFWLTREEGIWIIPSVFILLILNGWHVYHRGENGLLPSRFLIVVLLPIIICILGITLIATINKIKYDIFTINELKHDSFTSAFGAFLRVNHSEPIIMSPEWKSVVSVPRSVRDAVSRVSPAFRDINFSRVENTWIGISCTGLKDCDDMSGGMFLWALRHAVQLAGYHSDGKKAADYYRKLANEVNSACDKKLLQCGPKRSSLLPPLRREHLEKIPSTFIQGIKLISTFDDTRAQLYPSQPTSPEALELFRNISRCIISPPVEKQVTVVVSGWVFRPGDKTVDVKIISDSNNVTIERLEGKDVVKHFNDNSARNSRFQICATYNNTCKLIFSIKERPLAEAILNEKPLSFKIHDMKTLFFIDSISEISVNSLAQFDYATFFRIKILNRIADIYSKYFRYFGIISLICYFYTLYLLIRRKVTSLFLINSSLLLAIIARLLLLSLLHVTTFGAIFVTYYYSCVYPLMLIFMCLTIRDAVLYFKKRNQGTISTCRAKIKILWRLHKKVANP